MIAAQFEKLNQRGFSEEDAFTLLDETWALLPGKRCTLLPLAGSKDQSTRLALIVGLVLEKVGRPLLGGRDPLQRRF